MSESDFQTLFPRFGIGKVSGEKIIGRRRRTEERIEIHELLIVRTASGSLPALCDACSARDGSSAGDAILLSPEHASTNRHPDILIAEERSADQFL